MLRVFLPAFTSFRSLRAFIDEFSFLSEQKLIINHSSLRAGLHARRMVNKESIIRRKLFELKSSLCLLFKDRDKETDKIEDSSYRTLLFTSAKYV